MSANRFLDVNAHPKALHGILGLDKVPLVGLADAMEDVILGAKEDKFLDIPNLREAVSQCLDMAQDKLEEYKDDNQTPPLKDKDQLAAMLMYTLEFVPSDRSLYAVINSLLREPNRKRVQPFHKYLRLVAEAAAHMPRVDGKVSRGVKMGEKWAKFYRDGRQFTWWGFSSATLDKNLLVENSMFLGKSGARTLFQIQCHNGIDMTPFSSYPEEKEVLLLPGTRFKVVFQGMPLGDMAIVALEEVKPSFLLSLSTGNVATTTATTATTAATVTASTASTYRSKGGSSSLSSPVASLSMKNTPSSVASNGVLITDTDNHRVLAIPDVSHLLKMASSQDVAKYATTVLKNLKRPYDAIYHREGRVYIVADKENNRVVTFDTSGSVLATYSLGKRTGGGLPSGPTCLGLRSNGNVFVGHSHNGVLTEIDVTSQPYSIRKVGQLGKGIAYANGLVVLPDDRILVSDNRHRVLVLSSSGKLLNTIVCGFKWPWHMAAGPDGKSVWVTDKNNNRLCLLTYTGKLVREITKETGLNLPRGIAVCGDYLWVSNTDDNNLLVFNNAHPPVKVGTFGGLKRPGSIRPL